MEKITLEKNLEFFDEVITFWKARNEIVYSDDMISNIRQALTSAKFQPEITTIGASLRFDYMKSENNYAFFILGETWIEVIVAANTEFPIRENIRYGSFLRLLNKYGQMFSVEEKPEKTKEHSNLAQLITSIETTYQKLQNSLENLKGLVDELKKKTE